METAAKAKTSMWRNRKIKRGIFIGLMLSVGLVQFAVFWVYVNFNSILMAFQYRDAEGLHWGLEQFTKFFNALHRTGEELDIAVKNTLMLFVVGTIIGLPLNLLFAYYLFKRIPCAKFFRVIFFLPSIISSAVLVGIFKYIVATNGPVNELLSIMSGTRVEIDFLTDERMILGTSMSFWTILFYCFWTGFGSNIVLLTGALYRIPQDVLEYARLDGVGMTRELLQIVIPMIWPTLSTLLVFAAAGLFTNQGPVLLFSEGQYKTMTIGYYIYDQVKNNSYEYPAAIGLFFTAIGFPIVLFVRWLMGKIFEDVEY